jgi:hypothetical protein
VDKPIIGAALTLIAVTLSVLGMCLILKLLGNFVTWISV